MTILSKKQLRKKWSGGRTGDHRYSGTMVDLRGSNNRFLILWITTDITIGKTGYGGAKKERRYRLRKIIRANGNNNWCEDVFLDDPREALILARLAQQDPHLCMSECIRLHVSKFPHRQGNRDSRGYIMQDNSNSETAPPIDLIGKYAMVDYDFTLFDKFQIIYAGAFENNRRKH